MQIYFLNKNKKNYYDLRNINIKNKIKNSSLFFFFILFISLLSLVSLNILFQQKKYVYIVKQLIRLFILMMMNIER